MQRSTINYKYGLKRYDSHIIRAYTFATNAAGRDFTIARHSQRMSRSSDIDRLNSGGP